MYQSFDRQLKGLPMLATDGEIGRVKDLYFDDQGWIVRYLLVDTGHWLPGRKVLIAPESVVDSSGIDDHIPVHLTRDQVRNAPDMDDDAPVSRQHEIDLARHYNWSLYWESLGVPYGPVMPVSPVVPGGGEAEQPTASAGSEEGRDTVAGLEPEDPRRAHLRSVREVEGYHLHAVDGEIGHVDDVILKMNIWLIRYLVVDTRNWLPGRHVIISPLWSDAVDWEQKALSIGLTVDDVKGSPDYRPESMIDRDYEQRLLSHYGIEYTSGLP